MQAGIKTDRQTIRQVCRKEFRQTDTQTRVPINLGIVDGNDYTTTYINTSVYIRS